MSGSEFERENIVAETLSATAISKPDDAHSPEPQREFSWRPPAEGLYDPSLEKDSCGVGFIANIKGKKSHQIISDALNILCNLEHRGAFASNRGRSGYSRRQHGSAMPPATFTRLCDRKKLGMV